MNSITTIVKTTMWQFLENNIRIHQECQGVIEKSVPENHRLLSRCLPSDDKRWSSGQIFSILPLHSWWILFLAHHWLFILKSMNMLRCIITWRRHFDRAWTSLKMTTICVSSNTTNEQSSRHSLGKITLGKIRISDPGYLSIVQEEYI